MTRGNFSNKDAKRIADVVRRIERSPINDPSAKRQRRVYGGSKNSKLVEVRKGQDGDDFPSLMEHLDLIAGNQFKFQCCEVYGLSSSGSTFRRETDEEKWINVRNLAQEWMPQNTIVEAFKLAGEWVCYWRRQQLPLIYVSGTVAPVGMLPHSNDFSMVVETCSLGIIQELLADEETTWTVPVQNHHGWYVDENHSVSAIGHIKHLTGGIYDYYEKRTNLYDDGVYGDYLATLVDSYEFSCIALGCGANE